MATLLYFRFSVPVPTNNTRCKRGRVTMYHVSSPYFKQLSLGLWLDFCFTNFLDFNCDGHYDLR